MNQLQQKQYTGKGGIYQQLTLPISENILIDEHEPVYVANAQLEELDYTKLYQAYSSKGRKSAAEPRIMFKLLVYGYMCGIYSTRKLELACRKNIDFIWLLQGEKVPDYSSFMKSWTACGQSGQTTKISCLPLEITAEVCQKPTRTLHSCG